MFSSDHLYLHDGQECQGYVAFDDSEERPKPAVLIAHDWSGRNEFAMEKARMLAQMGYVGFAMDNYGNAQLGHTTEEKQALMNPLANDRAYLLERLKAAYDAVKQLPYVDSSRVAIMGFCFGGLCALDLARSGAELAGAISFHGLLNRSEDIPSGPITARVLVLHGYDDPMVPPDAVVSFSNEMTQAGADWQVHMYGNTAHGFTNPAAHDNKSGIVYNPLAEQRALESMRDFLSEVFSDQRGVSVLV